MQLLELAPVTGERIADGIFYSELLSVCNKHELSGQKLFVYPGQGSSVCIVTSYRFDSAGIESRWG